MTRLKRTINESIKQCTLIKDILESLKQINNTDETILKFDKHLSNSMYNPVLLVEFAQKLQISNDPKIFNQYNLDDIGLLFKCLLDLQKDNLMIYCEAAYFEYSVQDNSKEALAIIKEGLLIAEERINVLNDLKTKIMNEQKNSL